VQIRRPFVALFLAFLLLFAQQLSYAHAISHLTNVVGDSKNNGLPTEQACVHCIAFAQMDSAVKSEPFSFPITPVLTKTSQARSTQFFVLRMISAFQSRAPPAIF
jgi:hypothetical protein